MRNRNIRINRWRHFNNVELVIPHDASVVCLVGGNGSGKSQILELIAQCAQQIGLTPGAPNARGNPFSDDAQFEVEFYIDINAVAAIEHDSITFPSELTGVWDRTIRVSMNGMHNVRMQAGGVDPAFADQFANRVVELLRNSSWIHYLFLDADRSYPKIEVQHHELGTILDRDWANTSKQSSHLGTKSLYEEWFKYMLGTENRENNRYVQSIRLAKDQKKRQPSFTDVFLSYKNAVRQVLPHLLFVGVEAQRREILFNSTGVSLSFNQLSGGEREIAFLVGQIDRFSLKRGLLLVDEPELHLNYDLLRDWTSFLKSSVDAGQIWLATHSLEVVEVAGNDATFMLEKNVTTKKVSTAVRLSNQPLILSLSRAMGTPAFSIGSLVFVLVEGEEILGERERFKSICASGSAVRYIESGSCREVMRRYHELKQIAVESGQPFRIGGIIDGDWRTEDEKTAFKEAGLFVLDGHEVENFYLDPDTLKALLANLGNSTDVDQMIIEAADRRAWSWIFESARAQRVMKDLPPPSGAVRELFHSMAWNGSNIPEACSKIAKMHGSLSETQIEKFSKYLNSYAAIYERRRIADGWLICEGKEVFRSIIPSIGFVSERAAEKAISSLWRMQPDLVPKNLAALRLYVEGL